MVSGLGVLRFRAFRVWGFLGLGRLGFSDSWVQGVGFRVSGSGFR